MLCIVRPVHKDLTVYMVFLRGWYVNYILVMLFTESCMHGYT